MMEGEPLPTPEEAEELIRTVFAQPIPDYSLKDRARLGFALIPLPKQKESRK